MKWFLKQIKNNENGQAVIELAITIPVLILILCAIIDFGWVFTNKMFITYSSREGARFGTVNALETDSVNLIKNKIKNTAPSFIKDKLNITVTYTQPYDIRAGDVKVKITCKINALTPLTGIFVKDQEIPLEAECVMKIE